MRTKVAIPSGLQLASMLRFNGPCPPSPAADIQNAKTAGTSISAMFTLARSRAVLDSHTTRKPGNGYAASIQDPTSNAAAQPPRLTRLAPISRWPGRSSRPVARRTTIRHGAISGIGQLGNPHQTGATKLGNSDRDRTQETLQPEKSSVTLIKEINDGLCRLRAQSEMLTNTTHSFPDCG